jgi:hypothetical protein
MRFLPLTWRSRPVQRGVPGRFPPNFQPTTQPATCDVLYDFRVFWQQRAENQQVQSALQQFDALFLFFGRHSR